MTTLKERYSELIALTQLYMLREYSSDQLLESSASSFQFFKQKLKTHPLPESKPLPPNSSFEKPSLNKNTPPPPSTPRAIDRPPPQQSPRPPLVPVQDATEKLQKASAPVEKAPILPQQAQTLDTAPVRPAKNEEKPPSKPSFNLEPLPPPSPINFQDFREFVKTTAPSCVLHEQIPCDLHAKKMKERWKTEKEIPPVVILSFNEQKDHMALLNNIAKAITLQLAPAKVISGHRLEQEKKWEEMLNSPGLRLVIASDYGLYLLPDLMKHYKESAKSARHFLKTTPLLLLSDISLYLKEPQLKPLLWRAICNEFAAQS